MQQHTLIPLKDLLIDLPELAQAQLREKRASNAGQAEYLMEPVRGSSVLRTRPALLELARALYGFDHHTPSAKRTPDCEAPHIGSDGEPEWQKACPHLLRLWAARAAYQLAALNAPEDASPCHCGGTGLFRRHGKCYGCEGKGWQSPADVKRNEYHWNNCTRCLALAGQ